MKRILFCSILPVLVLACAESRAAVLIVSAVMPTNNPSGGNIFAPAFDAQPLTDPVHGAVGITTGVGYAFFGTGRWAGVDFGTNYANLSINDVFVLQGTYGNPNAVVQYFWSSDITWDGGDAAAPNFNLLNYTGNNSGGGADTGRWTNTYNNATGLTPSQRYLLVQYVSGSEGNFKYEMAFTGSVVPEPASGLLVLAGLSSFLLRRRALRTPRFP